MELARTKVIACATVMEEMLPLLPSEVQTQTLDFGLHLRPDGLRRSLQEAIDASAATADTLILGYGLCSQAVVGLHSNRCALVVPRVDDCIAIFLGSRAAIKSRPAASRARITSPKAGSRSATARLKNISV